MKFIDDAIRNLPELPDWQKNVRIDHIYTHIFLMFCNTLKVKPLEEILATRWGLHQLFCSTERLSPCSDMYDNKQAVSVWVPRKEFSHRVEFHYSTRHISSDTIKSNLHSGAELSIVAELTRCDKKTIIFEPIIIGSPWLEDETLKVDFDFVW